MLTVTTKPNYGLTFPLLRGLSLKFERGLSLKFEIFSVRILLPVAFFAMVPQLNSEHRLTPLLKWLRGMALDSRSEKGRWPGSESKQILSNFSQNKVCRHLLVPVVASLLPIYWYGMRVLTQASAI